MKDVVKPAHPKLLKRHSRLDHKVQHYQLAQDLQWSPFELCNKIQAKKGNAKLYPYSSTSRVVTGNSNLKTNFSSMMQEL